MLEALRDHVLCRYALTDIGRFAAVLYALEEFSCTSSALRTEWRKEW
jgi:hypothetical protein